MFEGAGLLLGAAGGIILGISTTLWLHTSGQVTGISGFVRGLIDPARLAKGGAEFKGAWVTAFMAVAAFLSLAEPSWVGVGDRPDATAAGYIIGGFLVGLGTSMSNGCTSGHGICGLARFSLRSVTAVMSFMLAAMLTATALEVNRPAFLVDVPTSVPGLQRMADVPNSNTPLFALIFGCIAAVIAIALIIYMWVADSRHEGIHTALAAAAGAVFSAGMGVGGMLNRGIIVSFLALAPGWNVRLAFVMGGGVTVAVGAFYWVKVRHSQLLASVGEACPATSAGEDMTPDEKEALTFLRRKYQVPTNTLVNFQLVFGAVVFGVGWGISGLCPGPALGLMSAGVARAWLWLPGFALGSWAWAWLEHALAQAGHRAGAGAPAPAVASPRPASPERPSVATARAVLQTAAAAVKDTQDVETGNTAGLLAHAQPACGPASMDALRAALPEDVHPVLCAALLAAAEEVQEEGTPSPRPRSASPRVSPELGAAEVAPEGAIDAVSRV